MEATIESIESTETESEEEFSTSPSKKKIRILSVFPNCQKTVINY